MAEYKLKEVAALLDIPLSELLELFDVIVWSQCEATASHMRCRFQADHGDEPHSFESSIVLQRENEREEARRQAEEYRVQLARIKDLVS